MKFQCIALLLFALLAREPINAQVLKQQIEFDSECACDVHADDDGTIYLGLRGNRFQVYENESWSAPIVLNDNSFSSDCGITKDSSGLVWYASSDGLFSYDENGEVTSYTMGNSDIPFDDLKSVRASGNTVWATENGPGLLKFEDGAFEEIFPFGDGFFGIGNLKALDSGSAIVSNFNLLAEVREDTILERSASGLIKDIFVEVDGEILIGTDNGIRKYIPESGEIQSQDSLYGMVSVESLGSSPTGEVYADLGDTVLYQDTSGNQITLGFSAVAEPNIESFFLRRDTLCTLGGNLNGPTCSVLTSLTGVWLDQDGDGVAENEDCNDNNPDVSPLFTETPYNGLDDDCDPTTPDDDLDEDGFPIAEDCDDENPDINPDTEEIPNNGIDEDCDGMDLVTSTREINGAAVSIYPNPATDFLYVETSASFDYRIALYDSTGKLVVSQLNAGRIDLSGLANGIYLLEITGRSTQQRVVERISIQ